ncbi:hypothetical protein [Enterococcus gilvus]|uniref:hypothetical protein n=1 Tax=Enterococcus gilvus TaxID=160453 RepID=UPI001C8CB63A|nr:hypothetical protein [Enterococcus gilvus]MBX8938924.1 hypothetical protein [Enterococcus gilvus]
MKKMFYSLFAVFLGLFVFGKAASADTIDIDTSLVPSTEKLTIDKDYIDLDSVMIEMDDTRYCIVENQLVPSIENYKDAGISPKGTTNWEATVPNGASSSRLFHTTNGQRVTYGSQPPSGTANRNMSIFGGGITYYNQTSNAGRMAYTFNSKGGQLTFRTTNYAPQTRYRFWVTQ